MAVSLSSPFAMLSQTSVMFTILDACEGENSTNKEMRNGVIFSLRRVQVVGYAEAPPKQLTVAFGAGHPKLHDPGGGTPVPAQLTQPADYAGPFRVQPRSRNNSWSW